MIEPPSLVETTPQLAAKLHLVVSRDDIRNVMGPSLQEVFTALGSQGVSPTGPWFTHHLRRPADTFDFEICVPVDSVIAASGRVVPGEWPAMQVARTIYAGPYEGLGEAWGEFLEWIESAGHRAAPDLWERYLVGPEATDDPAAWRTELNQPLLA